MNCDLNMSKYRLNPETSRRVIQIFGGQAKTGEKLGINQSSISRYGRIGFSQPYVLAIKSLLPEGLAKELLAPENLITEERR